MAGPALGAWLGGAVHGGHPTGLALHAASRLRVLAWLSRRGRARVRLGARVHAEIYRAGVPPRVTRARVYAGVTGARVYAGVTGPGVHAQVTGARVSQSNVRAASVTANPVTRPWLTTSPATGQGRHNQTQRHQGADSPHDSASSVITTRHDDTGSRRQPGSAPGSTGPGAMMDISTAGR